MDAETRRTWHAITDLLGAKWACHVVDLLADGGERAGGSRVSPDHPDGDGRGFTELQRELDVTAKTLSARLSELGCLGFVEREVHATSPPTTTYRLTEDGEALAAVMADVEDLVNVVSCPDDDCAVAAGPTSRCQCD